MSDETPMKDKRAIIGLLTFALLLVGLSGCRSTVPSSRSGPLRIGAAEMEITPPIGYRMAGYFDERVSTGIHDPLHAKAIVLQEGKTQLALVFCDLVGLSLNVTTNARALASRQTGIPVTNIVICATHTHTGPLFDDVRRYYLHQAAVADHGTDPHEVVDYPVFLIKQLAKVIAEAQTTLHPAELAAGSVTQEGVAFNRRYWMRNGKVAFNPGQLNTNIVRPAGPTDPEVGILLARDDESSQPFAGATIFAMHSDTVGGTLFSADYQYYFEQTLRERFGSNFVSAFGLGTCGDINHINVARKEPVSGFEVSERIGRTLGHTVLAASTGLTTMTNPALAVCSKTLQIPLQDFTPEQLANAQSLIGKLADKKADFMTMVQTVKVLDLAQRGPSWPMEVQAIRFDADTAMVCLPGEIFVELGLAIKRASPFKRTLVVSICNDRPSYVPTRKAFAEGSYEITNSRVKPGVGEMLVETALALLNQLRSAPSKN
jgi:neutral ceramidase